MKARLSMLAGLVVGVAVAGLLLGGLLAFVPEPPPPASPTPLVSAIPSPSADPSPPPSTSPSTSSSAATGPDVRVDGLKAILPGVDVTP